MEVKLLQKAVSKKLLKTKKVLLEIIYLVKNLFPFQEKEEQPRMEDLLKLVEPVAII